MIVANGSVDVSAYFVLRDSTDHLPKTDVTITDIDLYYCESAEMMSAKADATALAAANSVHSDNCAYHVGSGLYRIDWPDGAFNGGIGKTVILVVVCAGVDTAFLEVLLSPASNVVAINSDIDAASNLDDAASGGTYNLGGGAINVNSVASVGTSAITNNSFQVAAINADAIASGAITSAKLATDAIAAAAVKADAVTKIQAGLSTYAGGAVASVTGDVGGNVTGSVAAVLGNIGGSVVGSVGAVGTDGITAASLKADAITEIQSGLALEATLTAIKGAGWSTETLAAIKAAVDAKLDASGYTAPDNASVTAVKTVTDKLADMITGTTPDFAFDDAALANAPTGGTSAADIDTQLSSTHGAGLWGSGDAAGANTVTITVQDSSTDEALPGVIVTVKDSTGTTIIDQKRTGLAGTVVFSLDSATYKISVNPIVGYSSLAAQTLVVDGTETATYQLDPVSATAPTDANLRTVQIFLRDLGMEAIAGTLCSAQLRDPVAAVDGAVMVQAVLSDTTDVSGYAELLLPKASAFEHGSSRIQVTIGSYRPIEIEVPDGTGPVSMTDCMD